MRRDGSRLWLRGVVCLAVVSLISGCRKPQQESPEQKAIARHEEEERARREREWRPPLKNPDAWTRFKPKAHAVFLGPANPGAESGWSEWYPGARGGGSVAINSDDAATGLNSFQIGVSGGGSRETNRADIRSRAFSLAALEKTNQPLTFSFAYKLPGKVNPGDNLRVSFRFWDEAGTGFLGAKIFRIGSRTADSEMTRFKTVTVENIIAPGKARNADVWITANVFEPWTSGAAQFDDFSVTTVPGRSRAIMFTGIGACTALAALLIWGLYARGRRKTEV